MKKIITFIFTVLVASSALAALPPLRDSGPTFRPAEPMGYSSPSAPSPSGTEDVRRKWERPDAVQTRDSLRYQELLRIQSLPKQKPR